MSQARTTTATTRLSSWRPMVALLTVIALVLAGWALRQAQAVFMPLAFAFLVAILLRPVHRWLNHRLPDKLHWLSITLTMGLFVLALATLGGGIWLAFDQVLEQWDQYRQTFSDAWSRATDWARARNIPVGDLDVATLGDRLAGWAMTGLASATQVLAFLALLFFLTLLMLLESEAWWRKIGAAFDSARGDRVRDTVSTLAVRVRQYLWVRTVVSAVSGVAAALWLWLLGVDFWYLWGLLTFLLNYIPNIGSVISVIPPTLLALIQPDGGWLWALLVITGLIAIEQVIGNFVDPKLQGRVLSISPTVVLVAVVFWSWLWGVAGAVLAVPLTAAAVILCAHVGPLRPIALLLSRHPDPDRVREETHQPL